MKEKVDILLGLLAFYSLIDLRFAVIFNDGECGSSEIEGHQYL